MTPILQLENVSTRRGGVQILQSVSWTVQPGEHWVILGANGSGKSSLLSALGGYLSPTEGRIRVLGREFGATDWRELRKRIGIVAAAIGQQMHNEDTALEIVIGGEQAMIGTWGRTDPKVAGRARRMMKEFGIFGLMERRWEVLSQGERQRLLIARAMMTRPRLLILDEPCAGLDPVARRRFLQTVEDLTRTRHGPSVVLVTHHVEEITPAFSQALLLRSGEVFACGPARKFLTSENLSAIFNAPLAIRRRGDGYALVDAAVSGEI